MQCRIIIIKTTKRIKTHTDSTTIRHTARQSYRQKGTDIHTNRQSYNHTNVQ